MQQDGYAALLGLQGNLRFDWVDSTALAGNALGDPARRPVVVYTPPDYDAQGSRRYPTIYVLHGYSGDVRRMVSTAAWDSNVVQRVDRLIAQERMRSAIVVCVDAFTRLGGSQYVDSVHNGSYATYVAVDVVAHVDASYRTLAHEGGRAVAGKSSGGFGAMHLVLEHPGVFAAFASHSGDAYFQYVFPQGFAHAHRVLERYDFDLRAFVDAFEAKQKPGQADFDAMTLIAMSAAYSPSSNAAFDIELPFDTHTGEMRDAVFARWLAFDPVVRIPHAGAELERLRLRYLDCGRRDEYNLDIGARIVAERIRELGLDVRHEEFDDGHRNVAYRYDVSLPALADVLDER